MAKAKPKKRPAAAPRRPRTDRADAGPTPPIKTPGLAVVMRSVEALVPYARNARLHDGAQVTAIAASIREFGWMNPVLVDAEGGIIAGHGRVLAARDLGLTEVPCIAHGHLTAEQRRAYVLADNVLAEKASWDKDLLRVELGELAALKVDLTTTGFTLDEVDRLMKSGETSPDPDAAQPPSAKPVARLGDVWICGLHRVVCGDSTDPVVIAAAIGDGQADLLLTDPPYNVNYGDKAEALDAVDKGHRNTSRILNDNMSDAAFGKFLAGAFAAAASGMRAGAPAYVFHAETEVVNFRQAMLAAGMYVAATLIWRKSSLVLGRSDYHWQHEPVLYGWLEGAHHSWYGDRDKTTMLELEEPAAVKTGPDEWQICVGERTLIIRGTDLTVESVPGSVLLENKPAASDYHPTMKPVQLLLRLIRNSSQIGETVLDPFGGSGSTLIAAHMAQRRCSTVELDPKYCDCIVRRWQEFTGRQATHGTPDGPTYSSVEAQRVPQRRAA